MVKNEKKKIPPPTQGRRSGAQASRKGEKVRQGVSRWGRIQDRRAKGL